MTTIVLSTDPGSVVMSVIVTFLGVHISSNLIEQSRIANVGIWDSSRRSMRLRGLTACALGGVSTWIGYCLALGSSVFATNVHNNNIIMDGGILAASMICSVVLTFIGLSVGATNDRIFDKSKIDPLENSVFVGLAAVARKSLNSSSRNNNHNHELKYHNRLRPVLIGGCFHAVGLLLTEYIGILSIVLTGNAKIVYDTNSLVLSCIISWGGSTLSYWLLFRGLSMLPDRESLRIFTSIIFTATISGSHFSSMSSVQFTSSTSGASIFSTTSVTSSDYNNNQPQAASYTINPHDLLIVVVFLTIAIFWISLTFMWMDLRRRFAQRADCLHKVTNTPFFTNERMIYYVLINATK